MVRFWAVMVLGASLAGCGGKPLPEPIAAPVAANPEPVPVVDESPDTTADEAVLGVTEDQIVTAVNRGPLKFAHQDGSPRITKLVAAELPVTLQIFKSRAGDVADIVFTVEMKPFVKLVSINNRIDKEKSEQLRGQIAESIGEVAKLVDARLGEQSADIDIHIAGCMARKTDGNISGEDAYLFVSRKIQDESSVLVGIAPNRR